MRGFFHARRLPGALHPPGHPCVGCRGPSECLIEKESEAWLESIQRVFARLTDIPPEEIAEALRSPQLALFCSSFPTTRARKPSAAAEGKGALT